MVIVNTRIDSLRLYMFDVLKEILNSENYQINANFLSNDIENYSLDKLPVNSTVEKFINGVFINRDVYDFRSRKEYESDVMTNLSNIGFFEALEKKIKENNSNGILPKINGIQAIECLNCGAVSIAGTKNAEFTMQIQITYMEE